MIPETDSLASKQIGVAVIRDDRDLILIDRRLAKGLLGGFWEFPGGKIEGNETVQECIKREILEEIGIDIAVDSHLITIDHTYSHFRVNLQVYNCRYLSGEARAIECEEIRWVTIEELDNYTFPAANQEIIRALKDMVNSK
ncbi:MULTISPECIES: 8-oxo-dGTP diphosphatase MutT [unclassified Microcystis]|jgi:8-oxo-dGTP diphosphatase/A/G-specific adenine glycosylase|uniref:8-oxo-dGTP diphosphatase n=1 Tax=Microcystis flos-aquae Mf_QC_C_20070823_S10D TaxID=2486236 RepID=A0A552KL57_9CHRO|nr:MULTISPECIES: 8-oxo-dGTP diphosphatase MutT [unclassified Microcystis]MCA2818735.1 8-oxo-dGTP diphosphatase MutT [Microcystis sp. M085S1]MCA2855401.1 8-oxo-dGTP diphosphatase MutT [Microcystis sp. M065S1]TRT74885.1 MAG: 8-oxo-dGTP diphosphatase MutT [Microcystis flos-aquae Ma_QC_C_20070823_S18]TRU01936.1 MAG: 8-oxo-dGTP diphosphatase MutT [Microcystis flos-aquae Ma_QC_C_20070823_S18D]TRV08713.1 MAG: 8-oxo-dGTP diphosphatase MutT [Microcystis flos-aquae Mf_QC_C_20070823_S10D]TRV26740.1 MAG: